MCLKILFLIGSLCLQACVTTQSDNFLTNLDFFSAKQTPFKTVELGMTKQAVKDLIGVPEHIEIAGQSELQYEKWTYHPELQDQLLFSVIFFEEGKVIGWE